jgi:hypothetical protein
MNCPTALIMGGLTIALVVTDISYSQASRSMFHLFFGSLVTVLLFLLCQYGYERVNWILLALAFLFIVSTMAFMQMHPKPDECNMCTRPVSRCGCMKKKNPCHVCKKPKPVCKCNRNRRPL